MNFVTDIAQIKTAASLPVTIDFDVLKPYIDDAHLIFMEPKFPEAFMTFILQKLVYDVDITVHPPDDLLYYTQEQQEMFKQEVKRWELIHLLIKAESLYALHLSVDELAVQLSGAGVNVIASDTHRPAPQYQVMNLKERYIARAHEQMDLCLSFIKRNFDIFRDTCNSFYDPTLLIGSAEIFQKYADIHSSRRVFLALQPIIRNIEQRYILPTISRGLYDLIYSQMMSNQVLSDENMELLDYILPALAHLTMARALVEINIDILDWGIFNSADNSFKNVQNKTLVQQNRLGEMQAAYQRDGDAGLKALQEFLDNTASDSRYPDYFNSSRYVGPVYAVNRAEFVNSADKSIFVA